MQSLKHIYHHSIISEGKLAVIPRFRIPKIIALGTGLGGLLLFKSVTNNANMYNWDDYLNMQSITANDNENDYNCDWDTIHKYAKRSNLLGKSDAEIRDFIIANESGVEIESIQIRNVALCGQKYVTYIVSDDTTNSRYQFIIARGTTNIRSLMTGLECGLMNDCLCDMTLHSGYALAAKLVMSDILPLIDRNAKLRLTGHSYGAVIVTILASVLRDYNYTIDTIVTFGMPHFTDTPSHNDKLLSLPLQRIQLRNDTIASIKWDTLNGSYQNVKQWMRHSSYDTIARMNSKESKSIQTQQRNTYCDSFENIVWIDDNHDSNPTLKPAHRMKHYIKALQMKDFNS